MYSLPQSYNQTSKCKRCISSNAYGLGITLRVPIFDGFDKRARIRKAQIDQENAKLNYENTLKNMQTQYLNATNELMNNQRNFKKQKDY